MKYYIAGASGKPVTLTSYRPKKVEVLEYDCLERAIQSFFIWSSPHSFSSKDLKLMNKDKVLMYNTWDWSRGEYSPFRMHLSRDLAPEVKKQCIDIIKKCNLGFTEGP